MACRRVVDADDDPTTVSTLEDVEAGRVLGNLRNFPQGLIGGGEQKPIHHVVTDNGPDPLADSDGEFLEPSPGTLEDSARRLDAGSGIDRPESSDQLLGSVASPVSVITVDEAIVDLDGQIRTIGDRARRTHGPTQRARHHELQRMAPKDITHDRNLVHSPAVELGIEMAAQCASSIERRPPVSDQVETYHRLSRRAGIHQLLLANPPRALTRHVLSALSIHEFSSRCDGCLLVWGDPPSPPLIATTHRVQRPT
jgi:hypothetical protein